MAADASEQSFLYQAEWQIVETAQQTSADNLTAQRSSAHDLTVGLTSANGGRMLLARSLSSRSQAKALADLQLPQAERLQLIGCSGPAIRQKRLDPAAAGPEQAAALLQALQHFTASSQGLQHVAMRTEGSRGGSQAGYQPTGCAVLPVSAARCSTKQFGCLLVMNLADKTASHAAACHGPSSAACCLSPQSKIQTASVVA